MENRIRDAFDGVRAGRELKDLTARNVVAAAESRVRKKWLGRRFALAGAVCCLIAVLFGGWRLYFTPTSVISIDINPSLELQVNRFGRVIRVEGRNSDGTALAGSINVMHMSYERAVDMVLASPTVTECLESGLLTITVVELEGAQGEEILQYVSACTEGHGNAVCHSVSGDEVSDAHQCGMSYGKYRLYLQILEYADISPEQARSMTMGELWDMLEALESGAASDGTESNGDRGHGGHGENGHGHGGE